VATQHLPLPSCSIQVDDPATTDPVGRIRTHIRRHPASAIIEACATDPSGDTGVMVSLLGVTQINGEDWPQPNGVNDQRRYPNPLRVERDNSRSHLWQVWAPPPQLLTAPDQAPATIVVPANYTGLRDVTASENDVAELEWKNTTAETVVFDPRVTVKSAAASHPGGGRRVTLILDIDGVDWQLARGGNDIGPTWSGTINPGPRNVAPGATTTVTAKVQSFHQDTTEQEPSLVVCDDEGEEIADNLQVCYPLETSDRPQVEVTSGRIQIAATVTFPLTGGRTLDSMHDELDEARTRAVRAGGTPR